MQYKIDSTLTTLTGETINSAGYALNFQSAHASANDVLDINTRRATIVRAEINVIDMSTEKMVLSYIYYDEGEKQASWSPVVKEICYGKTYNSELAAFVGCSFSALRNFANNIYITPHYAVYSTPDNKIVMVVNKYASDTAFLFPHYAAYDKFISGHWAAYPDPETGRYSR